MTLPGVEEKGRVSRRKAAMLAACVAMLVVCCVSIAGVMFAASASATRGLSETQATVHSSTLSRVPCESSSSSSGSSGSSGSSSTAATSDPSGGSCYLATVCYSFTPGAEAASSRRGEKPGEGGTGKRARESSPPPGERKQGVPRQGTPTTTPADPTASGVVNKCMDSGEPSAAGRAEAFRDTNPPGSTFTVYYDAGDPGATVSRERPPAGETELVLGVSLLLVALLLLCCCGTFFATRRIKGKGERSSSDHTVTESLTGPGSSTLPPGGGTMSETFGRRASHLSGYEEDESINSDRMEEGHRAGRNEHDDRFGEEGSDEGSESRLVSPRKRDRKGPPRQPPRGAEESPLRATRGNHVSEDLREILGKGSNADDTDNDNDKGKGKGKEKGNPAGERRRGASSSSSSSSSPSNQRSHHTPVLESLVDSRRAAVPPMLKQDRRGDQGDADQEDAPGSPGDRHTPPPPIVGGARNTSTTDTNISSGGHGQGQGQGQQQGQEEDEKQGLDENQGAPAAKKYQTRSSDASEPAHAGKMNSNVSGSSAMSRHVVQPGGADAIVLPAAARHPVTASLSGHSFFTSSIPEVPEEDTASASGPEHSAGHGGEGVQGDRGEGTAVPGATTTTSLLPPILLETPEAGGQGTTKTGTNGSNDKGNTAPRRKKRRSRAEGDVAKMTLDAAAMIEARIQELGVAQDDDDDDSSESSSGSSDESTSPRRAARPQRHVSPFKSPETTETSGPWAGTRISLATGQVLVHRSASSFVPGARGSRGSVDGGGVGVGVGVLRNASGGNMASTIVRRERSVAGISSGLVFPMTTVSNSRSSSLSSVGREGSGAKVMSGLASNGGAMQTPTGTPPRTRARTTGSDVGSPGSVSSRATIFPAPARQRMSVDSDIAMFATDSLLFPGETVFTYQGKLGISPSTEFHLRRLAVSAENSDDDIAAAVRHQRSLERAPQGGPAMVRQRKANSDAGYQYNDGGHNSNSNSNNNNESNEGNVVGYASSASRHASVGGVSRQSVGGSGDDQPAAGVKPELSARARILESIMERKDGEGDSVYTDASSESEFEEEGGDRSPFDNAMPARRSPARQV